MDINEAFRRVVAGHLRLIAALVFVALAATFVLKSRWPSDYVASARIQASSATVGSDTEADSLLNRVIGVATRATTVNSALQKAGVTDRNATDVATKEITVTRLGSSAVMDISVTDVDPAIAQKLASAVAEGVVAFLGGQGNQQSQALITQLTAEQSQLYGQQQKLLLAISQATGIAATDPLTSQLSTVDQQLSDVGSTIRQLQVAIATNSSASVISRAGTAKLRHPSISTDLVLAGIAGLVGGLLIASILEIVIPRVADARAFARELGVPLLGTLEPLPPTGGLSRRLPQLRLGPAVGARRRPAVVDNETVVALRRAAATSDVRTLALVRAGSPEGTDALATSLSSRLVPGGSRAAAQNGRPHTENGHGRPGGALLLPAAGTWGGGFSSPASKVAPAAGVLNVRTSTLKAEPVTAEVVRVVPMTHFDGRTDVTSCALLVTVGPLTKVSQVHRIQDLAAATGWPVIGVLDDRSAKGKGRS
jgi:capsular polysaccharide biosynthesis protein